MLRYILDADNNPMICDDLLTWGKWMGSAERHVGITELDNGVKISTVFLGLDHSFVPDSDPVLYETMVFGGEHDGYQDRYSTRKEALLGHKRAVKLVESGKE